MSARPLPPLASLRAFAAAGRLGSFRDAAAGLHVTPSAVSRHVRIVEDWVGGPLFLRETRRVVLTDPGRDLSERLNTAFDAIGAALASAAASDGPGTLRVSALPLFTSVYLIPRLSAFEARHPGIAIEIETPNRVVDFDRDPVDVAIRNVSRPTPGLISHKLMDLRAVVLCAPQVAAHLKSPADLAGATLIHNLTRPDGWRNWLDAQGLSGLEARGGLSVDTVPAALDLAAHGRGVALGLEPMIWDAPQMAGLVVPFVAAPVSAGSYFLVHRRQDRARDSVQAFTAWLRQEVRKDAARYARSRSAHGRPEA
jgi:LysR family glycine cleavage system transcriptional activator